MQNAFVQFDGTQFMPHKDVIGGEDPGICLAPEVTWWAADDTTGKFRAVLYPLPASNADWRQAYTDAIVAAAAQETPDLNITHVVFPGLFVVEIPQV